MRLAFDDLVGWVCLKTTGHRRTPQDTPQETAGHTTGHRRTHHRKPQDTPQDTPGHTTGHHRTPQDTAVNEIKHYYKIIEHQQTQI